jgi:hypothetical protein
MKIVSAVILGFPRFWYDFLIGDCWQLAGGVAIILAAGAALLRSQIVSPGLLPLVLTAALIALVVLSAALEWRHQSAR